MTKYRVVHPQEKFRKRPDHNDLVYYSGKEHRGHFGLWRVVQDDHDELPFLLVATDESGARKEPTINLWATEDQVRPRDD